MSGNGSARTAFMAAASVVALAGAAQAQEAAPSGEDVIVVRGVRGAQQAAIDVKRNAPSIVDSIQAEDIGKLPDVTISDSLQRITGVQIRRSAGEGSAVDVRGLPQVGSLLNGEAFLGANSITTLQPNFEDIPSQLFSGADVIKAQTASQLGGGITGTVNLRTRRPYDLHDGITAAGAIEEVQGSVSDQWDTQANVLFGYHGSRMGALLSVAYGDVTLDNQYKGIQRDYGGGLHDETYHNAAVNWAGFRYGAGQDFSGGINNGVSDRGAPIGTCTDTDGTHPCGYDVNGDGDVNDIFFSPQAFTVWNRLTERDRLGVNGSFQFDVSDSMQFVADVFYTHQDSWDRTAGFQFQNVNWQAGEWVPGMSRDTGYQTRNVFDGGEPGTPLLHFNTVQVYNWDLPNFDSYAETHHDETQSTNVNLELKYDPGGRFRGDVRAIFGSASQDEDQSYLQFNLSSGYQWMNPAAAASCTTTGPDGRLVGCGHYPASLGGDRAFNALGYRVNSLDAVVDTRGDNLNFTLPAALLTELGNQNAYALKTMSSENNFRRDSDLTVIRADGHYDLSDSFNVDFGVRYSERSADNYAFERLAPLYNGDSTPAGGCLVKWKAFDVFLNSANDPVSNPRGCTAGDGAGFFTAGLTRPATDSSFNGQVIFNTDLAGIGGIPGLYVLNPAAMDDPQSFQNRFYPGNVEVEFGGRSFNVQFNQWSGYVQGNFEGDAGVHYQGNAGLRIIKTDLSVTQTTTGAAVPYAGFNTVGNHVRTERSFTDVLPAFNVAFDLRDDVKLRLAYARNMQPLDLVQWGGGLNLSYAIDTGVSPPIFRVNGGTQDGNPALDPWRSNNYDISLEWYLSPSSLVNVDYFYVEIDSFIQRGTITRSDLPDLDGVIRNTNVVINTPVQGGGATLKGLELSWQQSLEFLDAPLLKDFGFTLNYTYSPSDTGQSDLAGNDIPFQDNSKDQANAILWYQGERLQARIAANYRSTRAEQADFAGITGFELYQKPVTYIDASASYDVTPNFTLYVQGSNLTEENEDYYLTWQDQYAFSTLFERRITVGARARF